MEGIFLLSHTVFEVVKRSPRVSRKVVTFSFRLTDLRFTNFAAALCTQG